MELDTLLVFMSICYNLEYHRYHSNLTITYFSYTASYYAVSMHAVSREAWPPYIINSLAIWLALHAAWQK